MQKVFAPDYRNILDAAGNKRPRRLPIYDHLISAGVQEKIINKKFAGLISGNKEDIKEFLRSAFACSIKLGYDIYPFECCVTEFIQGGKGLTGKGKPLIRNMRDLQSYDWNEPVRKFREKSAVFYEALKETLPAGMKAVGGVGNGIFECVQDFVPYTDLVYLKADDPETYKALFSRTGEMLSKIWSEFLEKHSDSYAVCRFGDDLGFKSGPLLDPADIRELVIPEYRKIVSLVHKHNKPFLLHSCGCIFEVMDEIISIARIDSKHSNEDAIAPFSKWADIYGDRIGLFGGVDMNIICLESADRIKKYVHEVIDSASNSRGLAIGCGNSIPDYVPAEGYAAMCEAVREHKWPPGK